jgi:hypothetical protein
LVAAVPPEANRGALIRMHPLNNEGRVILQPNSEQRGPRIGDRMLSRRSKKANRLMTPIGEYRESFNLKGPKTFEHWKEDRRREDKSPTITRTMFSCRLEQQPLD